MRHNERFYLMKHRPRGLLHYAASASVYLKYGNHCCEVRRI